MAAEELEIVCEKLKKGFNEGVGLTGKLFRGNTRYPEVAGKDWCLHTKNGKAFCGEIMVGLSAVLSPDDDYLDYDTFATVLAAVCTRSSKATDSRWLEVLGHLISRGIDASRTIDNDVRNLKTNLTQAQQSGLYLLNRH